MLSGSPASNSTKLRDVKFLEVKVWGYTVPGSTSAKTPNPTHVHRHMRASTAFMPPFIRGNNYAFVGLILAGIPTLPANHSQKRKSGRYRYLVIGASRGLRSLYLPFQVKRPAHSTLLSRTEIGRQYLDLERLRAPCKFDGIMI